MHNLKIVRQVIKRVPQVENYLSQETKAEITSDDYRNEIIALVILLYYYKIDEAGFKEQFNLLVSKYLFDAYSAAWRDAGNVGQMPIEMLNAYNTAVATQKGFIDKYYQDIVTARSSGGSLQALLSRADLWATRYIQERNAAIGIIAALMLVISRPLADITQIFPAEDEDINMVWREGDTVEKCTECLALDGIVAPASLWRELRVTPQAAPNEKISCGGWRCQCTLEITDKPVTPNAREKIQRAIL